MEPKNHKLASFIHFFNLHNLNQIYASVGVAVVSALFLQTENTALNILLLLKQV